MKYRNYFIHLYAENPDKYLSSTRARLNLTEDANSLIRLHRFLEWNGIINYNTNSMQSSKA